jgi:hypothetical protein
MIWNWKNKEEKVDEVINDESSGSIPSPDTGIRSQMYGLVDGNADLDRTVGPLLGKSHIGRSHVQNECE